MVWTKKAPFSHWFKLISMEVRYRASCKKFDSSCHGPVFRQEEWLIDRYDLKLLFFPSKELKLKSLEAVVVVVVGFWKLKAHGRWFIVLFWISASDWYPTSAHEPPHHFFLWQKSHLTVRPGQFKIRPFKISPGVNPCEALVCKGYESCNIDRFGIAQCTCAMSCDPVIQPICGSDGKTLRKFLMAGNLNLINSSVVFHRAHVLLRMRPLCRVLSWREGSEPRLQGHLWWANKFQAFFFSGNN